MHVRYTHAFHTYTYHEFDELLITCVIKLYHIKQLAVHALKIIRFDGIITVSLKNAKAIIPLGYSCVAPN